MRRLAQAALVLPVLVFLAVVAHGFWVQRSDGALSQQQRRYQRLGGLPLTLTPAGLAPREGAGSHAGVDARRHGPSLPTLSPPRRTVRP